MVGRKSGAIGWNLGGASKASVGRSLLRYRSFAPPRTVDMGGTEASSSHASMALSTTSLEYRDVEMGVGAESVKGAEGDSLRISGGYQHYEEHEDYVEGPQDVLIMRSSRGDQDASHAVRAGVLEGVAGSVPNPQTASTRPAAPTSTAQAMYNVDGFNFSAQTASLYGVLDDLESVYTCTTKPQPSGSVKSTATATIGIGSLGRMDTDADVTVADDDTNNNCPAMPSPSSVMNPALSSASFKTTAQVCSSTTLSVDSKESQDPCVICLSSSVSSILMGCGHAVACLDCALVLLRQMNSRRRTDNGLQEQQGHQCSPCPLCRCDITAVLELSCPPSHCVMVVWRL